LFIIVIVTGVIDGHDYINASWVTQRIADLDMTNIYIAAQVCCFYFKQTLFSFTTGTKEGDNTTIMANGMARAYTNHCDVDRHARSRC
jgi:hypothetical protein